MVVSIEESQNIDEINVDDLQGTLTMHEQKFNRRSRDEVDQDLKVEDRYEGRSSRGRGNNNGRGRRRGRQSFNKTTVECFKCHKMGHFQYECPRWEKRANYVEVEEEDDFSLMAQVDDEEVKSITWFIDSGCSNHMCKEEGQLQERGLDVVFKALALYTTQGKEKSSGLL